MLTAILCSFQLIMVKVLLHSTNMQICYYNFVIRRQTDTLIHRVIMAIKYQETFYHLIALSFWFSNTRQWASVAACLLFVVILLMLNCLYIEVHSFAFASCMISTSQSQFCSYHLPWLWSPYGIGQTIIFLPCGFFFFFFLA